MTTPSTSSESSTGTFARNSMFRRSCAASYSIFMGSYPCTLNHLHPEAKISICPTHSTASQLTTGQCQIRSRLLFGSMFQVQEFKGSIAQEVQGSRDQSSKAVANRSL